MDDWAGCLAAMPGALNGQPQGFSAAHDRGGGKSQEGETRRQV